MKQDDTYKAALNKLETYIKDNGLRHTPERYTLLRHICALEQPFGIDTLAGSLSEEDRISPATIYNTINLLVSAQILHCVSRRDGRKYAQYQLTAQPAVRFELVCTRCGRISSFKDKAIENLIRTRKYSNFNLQGYSLYIYGECKTCKRKLLKDK